jgi:hypothetical protein
MNKSIQMQESEVMDMLSEIEDVVRDQGMVSVITALAVTLIRIAAVNDVQHEMVRTVLKSTLERVDGLKNGGI